MTTNSDSRYLFPHNIRNAHTLTAIYYRYLLYSAFLFDLNSDFQESNDLQMKIAIDSVVEEFYCSYHLLWSTQFNRLRTASNSSESFHYTYPSLFVELAFMATDLTSSAKYALIAKVFQNLKSKTRARFYLLRLSQEMSSLNLDMPNIYKDGIQISRELVNTFYLERNNIHVTPWHGVSTGHGADLLHALAFAIENSCPLSEIRVIYWSSPRFSINAVLESALLQVFPCLEVRDAAHLDLNDKMLCDAYRHDSLFNMFNPLTHGIISSDSIKQMQRMFRRYTTGVSDNSNSSIVIINIRTNDFKPSNSYEQSVRNTDVDTLDRLVSHLSQDRSPLFITAGGGQSLCRFANHNTDSDSKAISQYFLLARCKSLIASSTGFGHLWSLGAEEVMIVNGMSLWIKYVLPDKHLFLTKTPVAKSLHRIKDIGSKGLAEILLSDWVSPIHRDLFTFVDNTAEQLYCVSRLIDSLNYSEYPYTLAALFEQFGMPEFTSCRRLLSPTTFRALYRLMYYTLPASDDSGLVPLSL